MLLFCEAVMKKTALILLISLWLLANTMLLLIYPVQSGPNYTPYSSEPSYIPYPSEPNQEFPSIDIYSPKNEGILTVSPERLNFTVTKPDSWNLYWLTAMPVIGSYSVNVYLDDGLLNYYPLEDPGSSGFPIADYSVVLPKLSGGGHRIQIDVEAATYFNDPSPEPGDYLLYSKNITETIIFAVNADLTTTSPSTEPITPTSTPLPFEEPRLVEQEVILGLALAIAVLAVGLGLLLYLIKRK